MTTSFNIRILVVIKTLNWCTETPVLRVCKAVMNGLYLQSAYGQKIPQSKVECKQRVAVILVMSLFKYCHAHILEMMSHRGGRPDEELVYMATLSVGWVKTLHYKTLWPCICLCDGVHQGRSVQYGRFNLSFTVSDRYMNLTQPLTILVWKQDGILLGFYDTL